MLISSSPCDISPFFSFYFFPHFFYLFIFTFILINVIVFKNKSKSSGFSKTVNIHLIIVNILSIRIILNTHLNVVNILNILNILNVVNTNKYFARFF